jgi:hypothetical protein
VLINFLALNEMKKAPHPPYSPDLAPSDFSFRLSQKKSDGTSCWEFIRSSGSHSSYFEDHPGWDISWGFSRVDETIATLYWHDSRVCMMNQISSIHHNQFSSMNRAVLHPGGDTLYNLAYPLSHQTDHKGIDLEWEREDENIDLVK